jgi:hypothetical protein
MAQTARLGKVIHVRLAVEHRHDLVDVLVGSTLLLVSFLNRPLASMNWVLVSACVWTAPEYSRRWWCQKTGWARAK